MFRLIFLQQSRIAVHILYPLPGLFALLTEGEAIGETQAHHVTPVTYVVGDVGLHDTTWRGVLPLRETIHERLVPLQSYAHVLDGLVGHA